MKKDKEVKSIMDEIRADQGEVWEMLTEGGFTSEQMMVLLALYTRLKSEHHATMSKVHRRFKIYYLLMAIAWTTVIALDLAEILIKVFQ